jgi:putative ABC transport system permease protein
MRFLSALVTDAARGARSFLRSPGLAVAGSLTLALGIGAATALFSVVNAVLVRPLPYERPETRVMIWSRWTGFDKTWVSEQEVCDYRRLPAFRHVAAWSSDQGNLTGDGDPVRVGIAPVTTNAFSTLGAEPVLGRQFRPEEEKPGADAVVLVSYRLWQGRYGGDPGLVGRTISACPRTTARTRRSPPSCGCRSTSIRPPSAATTASTRRGSSLRA